MESGRELLFGGSWDLVRKVISIVYLGLEVIIVDILFNPFPLILKRPPPSLILKLDFGGSILILGGFPAPAGMTGPCKSLNYSRGP